MNTYHNLFNRFTTIITTLTCSFRQESINYILSTLIDQYGRRRIITSYYCQCQIIIYNFIIRRETHDLAERIQTLPLVTKLYSLKVLTDYDVQVINSKLTRYEQGIEILSVVQRGPDRNFNMLCRALNETNQGHLVSTLLMGQGSTGKYLFSCNTSKHLQSILVFRNS